jgi:hypothetical protein
LYFKKIRAVRKRPNPFRRWLETSSMGVYQFGDCGLLDLINAALVVEAERFCPGRNGTPTATVIRRARR